MGVVAVLLFANLAIQSVGDFCRLAVQSSATHRLAPESGRLPIQSLRIHNPHHFFGETSSLAEIHRLVKAKPNIHLQILIEGSDQSFRTLERTLSLIKMDPKTQRRIDILATDGQIYAWAQDDSKSFQGEGGLLIAESQAKKYLGYRNAIETLRAHRHVRVTVANFDFEGGDLIVGERHIFIGSRSMRDSLRVRRERQRPGASKDSILRDIEAMTHLPARPIATAHSQRHDVGSTLFHLDIVFALVWNKELETEVAVVPSINQAVELLSQVRPHHRDYVSAHRLLTLYIQNLDFFHALKKQLRAIRTTLEDLGYPIVEVPGFYIPPRVQRNIPIQMPEITSMYSYTNIVIDPETIIMPTTRIEILDDAAAAIYRSLDYDVHRFDSFWTYRLQGGPRCLMNVCR